ncbi:MAG: flagellar export protein FliJ [Pseudomonas sp.]
MTTQQNTALDTLIGLTREALDRATKLLANERRTQEQVQQQLNILNQYRLEYGRRLQQSLQQGMDPASLLNYRAFLSSLDTAVLQANQALRSQQQKVDNQQQQWREERRRLHSYDTLLERRRLADDLLAYKAEQKANDEYGMRANRNNNGFR